MKKHTKKLNLLKQIKLQFPKNKYKTTQIVYFQYLPYK